MSIDLSPKTKYNQAFGAFYILATIFAIIILPWWQLAISYLLFFFFVSFGIGFGLHRVVIHHSVKVPDAVRRFATLVGTLCNQGSPITWGTSHYLHHANSDKESDPHSPVVYGSKVLFGYFATDEIIKNNSKVFTAVRHIARDKFNMILHRKYYAIHVAFYLAALVLFGWQGLLAYAIVPTGLGFLSINMQNYFAHGKVLGYTNFQTGDYSRNIPFMLFFTFGENWHNNHHNKANAITTKVKWWEIDPTYIWCWMFNVDNHAKWKAKLGR